MSGRFVASLGGSLLIVIGLPLICIRFLGPPEGDELFEPARSLELSRQRYVNLRSWGDSGEIVLLLRTFAYGWTQIAHELADMDLRVVSYDRIGFGHSSHQIYSGKTSIRNHARDLLDVMDALAIDRTIATGWGIGGAIVVQAALLGPSRFRGIVFVNIDSWKTREPSIVRTVLTDWASGVAAVVLGLTSHRDTLGEELSVFAVSNLNPRIRDLRQRELEAVESMSAPADRLPVPILLIERDGSRDLGEPSIIAWLKMLPHAQVVRISSDARDASSGIREAIIDGIRRIAHDSAATFSPQ